MNLWNLALREIAHRKVNFLLAALSVAVAAATFVGSMSFLNLHDRQTDAIMAEKEKETEQIMAALREEMRKAGLDLSHNLLILPRNQNLKDYFADDYAREDMPEDAVDRLAGSGIVVARHFLPSLRQRIEWPEMKRTIILIGSRGQVPNLFKDPRKPLVQAVPPETIVLGSELARGFGLAEGDRTMLMGRELTVHRVHSPRGNEDDITAWIYLPEAQALLGKEGRINSILALECMCPIEGVTAKQAIEKILPDTQVVEMGTHILARQDSRARAGRDAQEALQRVRRERDEQRMTLQRLMAVVLPLVMIACVVWVGMLAYQNVGARRSEIGLFRALGVSTRRIVALVLAKALAAGGLGGLLGGWLGIAAAGRMIAAPEPGMETGLDTLRDPALLAAGLVAAVVLTVIATWVPGLLAAGRDPADVLRGE